MTETWECLMGGVHSGAATGAHLGDRCTGSSDQPGRPWVLLEAWPARGGTRPCRVGTVAQTRCCPAGPHGPPLPAALNATHSLGHRPEGRVLPAGAQEGCGDMAPLPWLLLPPPRSPGNPALSADRASPPSPAVGSVPHAGQGASSVHLRERPKRPCPQRNRLLAWTQLRGNGSNAHKLTSANIFRL